MEIPVVTPSSINDLVECAKKLHTLRVRRQWPTRPGVHLGVEFAIGFHAVIKPVYDPRHPPLPRLDDLDLWARTAFYARRYPDAHIRDTEMQRCIEKVCEYVAYDSDAEATSGVEVEGAFPIHQQGRHLFDLHARLDRVLVRETQPDHCVIRVYKCSSARSVNLLEAYVLLRVAKLLYPEFSTYAVEFDWIADGSISRDVVRGSELKGFDSMVKLRALEVFTDDDFPAEPGDGCFRCPLRRECQSKPPVMLDEVFVEYPEVA